MKHGFKAFAERKAVEMRRLCGLGAISRLPARRLAEELKVKLLAPTEIHGLPVEVASMLLTEYDHCWSAVTIKVGDVPLVIYNNSHVPERQESDLMHEFAHLICGHKPARIEPPGVLPFATRTFDPEQEEEANWLGSCLQIPREAFLKLLPRRYDNLQIASHFGASPEMVLFRRNLTGVDKQLAARNFMRRARFN